MYVMCRSKRYWPLDRVVRISHSPSDTFVAFEGVENEVAFDPARWSSSIESWIRQLIPAEQGTYKISAWLDEGENPVRLKIQKETIIAWAVNGTGQFLPVTAEGIDCSGYPVLMPDGRVEVPFAQAYPTLEQYIAAEEVSQLESHNEVSDA